jgi:hypothetical protein
MLNIIGLLFSVNSHCPDVLGVNYPRSATSRVGPVLVTLFQMPNVCARIAALWTTRDMHTLIVQSECESDLYVGSNIGMCVKCRLVYKTHEDHQDLTSYQKRKETNSWTDCTELHIIHPNELQGLTSTYIEMTSSMQVSKLFQGIKLPKTLWIIWSKKGGFPDLDAAVGNWGLSFKVLSIGIQDTSCGFHNPPESSPASVHKRFMNSWPHPRPRLVQQWSSLQIISHYGIWVSLFKCCQVWG